MGNIAQNQVNFFKSRAKEKLIISLIENHWGRVLRGRGNKVNSEEKYLPLIIQRKQDFFRVANLGHKGQIH